MNERSNRVALVTGGAGALGRAIGARLAKSGVQVAVADLDVGVCNTVAADLGNNSFGVALDVTSADSVQGAVDSVMANSSRVDILINCAGISVSGDNSEMEEPDFVRTLDVNLKGPFLVVRSISGIMKAQKYGRIVSICTRNSLAGGMPAYGSSKAGLEALTISWAREFGQWDITANAVAPGPVAVENGLGLVKRSADEQLHMSRHYIARTPIRRLASCNDVAAAVAYFASEEAGFVTGEILRVAGGAQLAPIATYPSDTN